MNRLLFIVLLQVCLHTHCSKLNGQTNYLEYHRSINIAEEHISKEQFLKALDVYDFVFKGYNYVYTKDFIIAAQIAVLGDSIQKASRYIERAIIGGYPCQCVEGLPIFKDYISSNTWSSIKSKEKEYKKDYYSHIRTDLLIEFSKRYRDEQDNKTRDKFEIYNIHVISNFQRIKSLMDSLVFPSERIIGFDKSSIAPLKENKLAGLRDCSAGNSKVIASLLHYDNPITAIGIDKFIKAIELGYLHPKEFARIFTFEKFNVSRLTKDININKENLPDYNFNFPFGQQSDDIDQVNVDRERFGIYDVATEKNINAISKKYRLKINFDYK